MLSILIPTYNYNVYPLVTELKKQIDELAIEYEILVQDDSSKSSENIKQNSKIKKLHFYSSFRFVQSLFFHNKFAMMS